MAREENLIVLFEIYGLKMGGYRKISNGHRIKITRYGLQSHDDFNIIRNFLYGYFATVLKVLIPLILFVKNVYFFLFFYPKIGLNAYHLQTQMKIIQVI